jgi:hypothetical protein
MEVEDHRLIVSEDGSVLIISEAVRVVAVGLKLEQIHNIDEANLDLRKMLAKQSSSCKSFLCADITTTGHDNVRLFALAVGGPIPNSQSLGAVADSVVHVQVL